MNAAAPAEFYDQVLADPAARQLQPLNACPWLPLYRQAAALVPARASVVDLGCGTGRFARMLGPRGGYIGIDFSPASIAEAERYAGDVGEFRCADLRDCDLPAADAYVALEVLEHLDDDVSLLDRIPAGALVVLSVPSFDSAAHVRVFNTAAEAAIRYRGAIAFTGIRSIPLTATKTWHLLSGVRRSMNDGLRRP